MVDLTEMVYYTPEIQAANRKLWTDALRSGEYQQGRSYLHKKVNDQHYYCCLGVACEVAEKHGVKLKQEVLGIRDWYYYRYDTASSYLPWAIMHWLGLFSQDGSLTPAIGLLHRSLTVANDAGMTFPEIADLIDNETVEIKRY